jgi:hypothetical protein
MGRYLDMLDNLLKATSAGNEPYDKNDINDQTPPVTHDAKEFGRIDRFCRSFESLERRCPASVGVADWQHAVEDGRRFLDRWRRQAEALGWRPADLFGLHEPPEKPASNYRRLSRVDAAGLVWLLHGRPVVALTADSATIRTSAGGTVTFHRRPA